MDRQWNAGEVAVKQGVLLASGLMLAVCAILASHTLPEYPKSELTDLKTATAVALRQQHRSLRDLFANSSEGIFVLCPYESPESSFFNHASLPNWYWPGPYDGLQTLVFLERSGTAVPFSLNRVEVDFCVDGSKRLTPSSSLNISTNESGQFQVTISGVSP